MPRSSHWKKRSNGRGETRVRNPQRARYQIGDWLLWQPALGWGVACDYNLNQSPTNREQACGPRFQPSIVAERNTGIQRTLLYGVGDIRWYPSHQSGRSR